LIDVGATTRIEKIDHPPRRIAHVIELFSRSTRRGDQDNDKFQKIDDDGIQIALKYLGEYSREVRALLRLTPRP
jgi:hypothetical protein